MGSQSRPMAALVLLSALAITAALPGTDEFNDRTLSDVTLGQAMGDEGQKAKDNFDLLAAAESRVAVTKAVWETRMKRAAADPGNFRKNKRRQRGLRKAERELGEASVQLEDIK